MKWQKQDGRPKLNKKSPDLQFFDVAYQNFRAATYKTGEVRLYYNLIGFTFCLNFAGNSMVDVLTPALKHLEVKSFCGPCDLTVCIWDSVSTQTPPIEFPWAPHDQQFRGEVKGYSSDRVPVVLDIHTKVLNVLDHEQNVALYWIKNRQDLPWWIGGSPLQLVLHWWMRAKGYQLTHAAVVGYPKGGVLLAGKSGSGKSTTALACMKAGMKYVSEDYCFLSDLPQIWAYSVYNSSKIGEKTLQWFPELSPFVINSNRAKEDKAFLFHHEFQPQNLLAGCPIKAIITLKIGERLGSGLEPIDSKEALAALSTTTLWQLTHTGPIVFHHLRKIAEALPCYRLHLSEDLMHAAELIGELL
ncbi:MAG TPA: hypothetical protein VHL30_00450 [Chlamydiales bacterium]|jgi:hypothetical protein|nr:hypothetical protein [Chlamydiales bacterium]